MLPFRNSPLVDAEAWDHELTKALNASLSGGLEPSQAWEVCKSIIEPWSGNNQWRDRVADVVVGWYAPYVR